MTETSQDGPDDAAAGRPDHLAAPMRARIRVVVDDLAFVTADAVLRPADEALNPVTPAASRLDQLAGEEFARQRRVSTPFEAGAAVVTGAGDLTASFVIHLVIRDDRSAVRPDIVRRALVSAWQRAKDWQLGTLAAPLVGAGAGQLGVEDAAALLAETFTAARASEPGAASELCIVVEHERDREIVEAVVGRGA
jgi:O-acetyl-ADP-ribose deacetylase (regulator of RNase III)